MTETLRERLAEAQQSYVRWQNGVDDGGPSGAARCARLYQCVDEALAVLDGHESALSAAREEAARAERERLEIDYGKVWSAIRSGLTMYRERLVEALAAPSHEREAAVLDDIARELTDRIAAAIRKGDDHG